MTRDEFWATIERARVGASDAHEVAVQLQRELESKSLEQIEAFLDHRARVMEHSYDFDDDDAEMQRRDPKTFAKFAA